uniref:Cytochrome c oxidase subunit 3 n=1 Tax=Pseudanoplocephala crawfordi TaxID=1480107 RepID=A0A0U2N3Y8_9CEST|nr:cytochrome c oxidase subunit III [Pseudanoplocephala crawfordi]ALJ78641.1 cytochrome c oxidase subunit 3 [Pseudanoplocephala crawfordi]
MSVFPIFNAFYAGFFLFGLFTWKISLLLFALFCMLLSIILYLYDSENIGCKLCYVSGFWLFILSEVIVFGSLLFCCLYFDYNYYINLSSALELPFLGCFFLLGSSLTVTSYHHLINWELSWVPLLLTIILGSMFIFLQMFEMEEIMINIYDTTFHASSFCTVGLHFSHVLLGVIALITVLTVSGKLLGYYHCSIVVWYWHFVDYVWLFVYTFVYIC